MKHGGQNDPHGLPRGGAGAGRSSVKENDGKTEFLILGTRTQLSKITSMSINIGNEKKSL